MVPFPRSVAFICLPPPPALLDSIPKPWDPSWDGGRSGCQLTGRPRIPTSEEDKIKNHLENWVGKILIGGGSGWSNVLYVGGGGWDSNPRRRGNEPIGTEEQAGGRTGARYQKIGWGTGSCRGFSNVELRIPGFHRQPPGVSQTMRLLLPRRED